LFSCLPGSGPLYTSDKVRVVERPIQQVLVAIKVVVNPGMGGLGAAQGAVGLILNRRDDRPDFFKQPIVPLLEVVAEIPNSDADRGTRPNQAAKRGPEHPE
jgi:hypothetical protein